MFVSLSFTGTDFTHMESGSWTSEAYSGFKISTNLTSLDLKCIFLLVLQNTTIIRAFSSHIPLKKTKHEWPVLTSSMSIDHSACAPTSLQHRRLSQTNKLPSSESTENPQVGSALLPGLYITRDLDWPVELVHHGSHTLLYINPWHLSTKLFVSYRMNAVPLLWQRAISCCPLMSK